MKVDVRQAGALILGCAFGVACAHGVDPERPSGGNAGSAGSGAAAGAGPGGAAGGAGGGGTTTSETTTSTASTTDTMTSSTTRTTTSSTTSSTTTTTSSTTTTTSSTTTTTTSGTGGPFPDCLKSIPANCPVCATMNASDKPKCQEYLDCYFNNGCKPTDACGQNDGVCGVNKIGGGNAPQSAAVATYMCACL